MKLSVLLPILAASIASASPAPTDPETIVGPGVLTSKPPGGIDLTPSSSTEGVSTRAVSGWTKTCYWDNARLNPAVAHHESAASYLESLGSSAWCAQTSTSRSQWGCTQMVSRGNGRYKICGWGQRGYYCNWVAARLRQICGYDEKGTCSIYFMDTQGGHCAGVMDVWGTGDQDVLQLIWERT